MGQSISIAVLTTSPVLDFEIELFNTRQLSSHLGHGLRRPALPLQSRMVGSDNKFPAQEVLPESS